LKQLSFPGEGIHITEHLSSPANASRRAILSDPGLPGISEEGSTPMKLRDCHECVRTIPYASVRVKDTAAENLTNAKGEYKFEIPQGSEILIISAKGYTSQEIAITKSRVYNVKLTQ
jgi:hypothetical protein